MTPRRCSGDRGAVLVEFAFVMPVLMVLLLALADFGLAELSDAAGANAAREGARVGILYFDGADAAGANHTKIVDAVNAKLANNVKGTPVVAVRCLTPGGAPRPSGGSCSTVGSDAVDVGQDLIEVTVTWTRRGGLTAFVRNPTRTDKAVMRIVGTPPTGAVPPPTTCAFASATAAPSSVIRSGTTIPNVTFDVTVNDAILCGTPLLDLGSQAGYAGAQAMTSSGTNTFSFTLDGSVGSWTAGSKTVTASANGGSVSTSIAFTVSDPSVCLITASSTSPNTVNQTSGTLASAVVVSVTVSNVAACGTPTLTFPANAGYPTPRTMIAAGGNSFTFTLPASQGTWASQTYAIAANANGGATASIGLVVTSPAVCSLSNLVITPGTASVKKSGQEDIQTTVTITVTRNNLAVCAVPTVTVTPGNSGQGSTALTSPQPMNNVGSSAACTSTTCEYEIASGTRNWWPAPSNRTVTVTASGSTVTGTLALT